MSKLVRDKIPDLMRAEGLDPVVTVDRSAGPLLAKLHEETEELAAAPDVVAQLDELADVFEVVLALVRLYRGEGGLPEVVRHARVKRERRGGFRAGRILHSPPHPQAFAGHATVDLHNRSMDQFERGLADEAAGHGGLALSRFRIAFDGEREVARRLAGGARDLRRAVIYRSAAAMATKCGELAEARRLVAEGLAGDPHPEIAAELREVLADVEAKEQRP